MAKQAKTSYRVNDWSKYNKALVSRGDITLWLDDDALENWEHANEETKVGAPFVYSDTAIEWNLSGVSQQGRQKLQTNSQPFQNPNESNSPWFNLSASSLHASFSFHRAP